MPYSLRKESISPLRSISKQPYPLYGLSGTAAAYSLRKFQYTSTKAIRVRRSSDNDETDIDFIGVYLNARALLDFVGAGNGLVTTWYDQSGNGNNATMATADNQPRIVNAGVIDVDANGRPQMYFDGTNDVLTIANSASVDITSQPLMINSVFQNNSQTGYIVIKNLDSAATNQYGIYFDSSPKYVGMYLEGSPAVQTTSNNSVPINTQKIYSGIFNNGIQQGFVNGLNSGIDGSYNSTLTSRANMNIGARSNNVGGTAWSSFFKGYISEIIILTSIASRDKFEKNQSKYYGITIA
jgi:hypothetical protein